MTPTTHTQIAPVAIGALTIDPPLALAPMAGFTDYPYRRLVRAFGGCGLVTTELISSAGLHYNDHKTYTKFTWSPAEHPVAVQIYGADPSLLAEAAADVAGRGADMVDINMGCPVPKLTKKGAGAALMRDVDHAVRVIAAVVEASPVPVTVKLRAGWDADALTAPEIAAGAEAVGAAAVTVHARTAKQRYTGSADPAIIAAVKDAVQQIPVFGNGDVGSAGDVRAMMAATGCDGVAVGRAALGKPWLFAQIAHELHTGEPLPAPSLSAQAAIMLHHARLALAHAPLGEYVAAIELRKHMSKYRLPVADAKTLRRRLTAAVTLAEIEAILQPLMTGITDADAPWLAALDRLPVDAVR